MESVVIIADSKSVGFKFAKGIYERVCKKEGRSFLITLADIFRTKFKDGEYKLKISENIRRKKCFFIHDSNKEPKEWLSDLIFTLEAMKSSSPTEINVVFPYLRFSRQDRKDSSRVCVNVKAVADIVSLYADRGLTMDLHAPQIKEFFNIPFDNLRSYPVLIGHLLRNNSKDLNNFVVVSPDAGGGKRVEGFQKMLGKYGVNADMGVCYKKRSETNVVSEIKIMGDVAGKNCLIIDDIIDTGDTLVKTAYALREAGALKIMAYGTHCLFTSGIGKFDIFDSVLAGDTLRQNFEGIKFETVSLIDLFGEAVYRTIMGQSLSSLFE